MEDTTKELFDRFGGIMQTFQLIENGIYYKKIVSMVETGQIERIKQGYYCYVSEGSYSDYLVLNALFPDGILCLESALDYYGYLDRTPSAFHIAIIENAARSRFSIDYPIVKPHFTKANKIGIGVNEVEIEDTKIKIYDRERTICDILLHRNKIDSEIFATAIRRYANDPKRSINRLMQYSKQLRVEKKVKEVIGILL